MASTLLETEQVLDFLLQFSGFGFFLGFGAGAEPGVPGTAPDLLLKVVFAFAEEEEEIERKNLRQPLGASIEVEAEEGKEESLLPLLQDTMPLRP